MACARPVIGRGSGRYTSVEHRPWKPWYSLARWRRLRSAQLAAEPLCGTCAARGLVVPATVADHVEPHRGDADKFWNGRLQSLCAPCHSRDKQREENGGRAIVAIACDGWPVTS